MRPTGSCPCSPSTRCDRAVRAPLRRRATSCRSWRAAPRRSPLLGPARVAFGPCLLTARRRPRRGRWLRGGARRGGGGRRPRRRLSAGVGDRSAASAAARPCGSACTPTASAPSSRGGPRTWRAAPLRTRADPHGGRGAVGDGGAVRQPSTLVTAPTVGDRGRLRRPSPAQLHWMLRRLGSFHPVAALLFPIPLAAFVAPVPPLGWSLRLARRPVTWRGRRDPGPTVTLPLAVDLSPWGTLLANVVGSARDPRRHRLRRAPAAARPPRARRLAAAPAPRRSAAVGSTSGRCASGRGSTACRRPARCSPAACASASCSATSPRFVGRDPPRRARPLAGPRRQPGVRALEPARSASCSCWPTALAANVPCIAVQRYNRQRAQRVADPPRRPAFTSRWSSRGSDRALEDVACGDC